MSPLGRLEVEGTVSDPARPHRDPGDRGQPSPASSARRRYSATVARPMEQLLAIIRLVRGHPIFPLSSYLLRSSDINEIET